MRHIDHFLPFLWVITHDLWSREDFDALWPPIHDYRRIDKTWDFSHFWPFSWVITHDLWSREYFPCMVTPLYTIIEASANT